MPLAFFVEFYLSVDRSLKAKSKNAQVGSEDPKAGHDGTVCRDATWEKVNKAAARAFEATEANLPHSVHATNG